jgi:spore coat polysaccharide biosynthesis protein SpsF
MKILGITQARVGSTRLPGKIFKQINGQSLLEIHLQRILKSKLLSSLKIATTFEVGVEKIMAIANDLNVAIFQGSTDNVLDRFFHAAQPERPDYIVRFTSDCPLIDPDVIDSAIQYTISHDYDYGSNTLLATYPDGLDVEVFKYSALVEAFNSASLKSEREHVTPYIWKNSTFMGGNLFKSGCLKYLKDFSDIRITVDTEDDFHVIEQLVHQLGIESSWLDYISFLKNNSEIMDINKKYARNEGYIKSIDGDKV